MSTPTKPLEIFRPGRHTAMSGAVLDFSEADLAACARAYDPALHEAPLVVGHPRHDAPAYGWVKRLSFDAGLEADPHQLDPAFAEMVGRGSFKKISSSFYAPDSPQNPVPGVYYLRHVGFLGAQPPAVKGLRNPEFAEAEAGVVEFGDWSDMQNANLWRRMREWIIGRFGVDEADKTIPSYSVETLEAEARQEDADETPLATPAFSELQQQETPVTPEQKAAIEAENVHLKQQLAEVEAREKAAKSAALHVDNIAFAEKLAKEGRLLPVHKDFIASFMDHLAEAGVVEFGEGADKQAKPALAGFKDYLAAQPKLVDFQERAGGEVPGDGQTIDFAAPTGAQVNQESLGLHARAVAYQQQHQVEYTAAIKAVGGR
jgi:hypothetical protein